MLLVFIKFLQPQEDTNQSKGCSAQKVTFTAGFLLRLSQKPPRCQSHSLEITSFHIKVLVSGFATLKHQKDLFPMPVPSTYA